MPDVSLQPLTYDDLLTIHEVAQILRVDDTTVRRWVNQGTLEAVILPHKYERQAYRVSRKVVEALLAGTYHITPAS